MLKFILTFYLLCALFSWGLLRTSYSKGGRWENINPTFFDVLMVLIPIFNFILCIFLPIMGVKKKVSYTNYQKHNKIKGSYLNSFFRIKK